MSTSRNRKFSFTAGAAISAIAASIALTSPAQAIVPNDNFTPDDIVDNEGGVNGVGMFFRSDGFVCSGSLINPRTVLFAAHCVNSDAGGNVQPDSAFNENGLRSAFSFDVNALPGFQYWISNGFVSNPDLFVYNVNQIRYNPDSVLRPEARGFLEADIALATLDTPATNIPTWALLFSALPAPDSIDPVSGTGYHATITGYGATGSGTNGSDLGIDWRRKAAENYIGALASLNERNEFLFGPPGPNDADLPQNLYLLDFDDPDRANPFDFNLWRDDALPNEGTTAGGDSGGPLIVDQAFDEEVVVGVLSGGTRFFLDQPRSSYGGDSFYQPLYLFWDYIVATNPYRYVSARRGSGDWENGFHWVTDLDPVYRTLDADGNLVNALPRTPGAGINGTEPDFGEVCFIQGTPADGCQDLETGALVPASGTNLAPSSGNNLAPSYGNNLGAASLPGFSASNSAQATTVTSTASAADTGGGGGDPRLPRPTLDNGLPGATGFVPNNIDPDPVAGINARYFDVTLDQPGQTRLRTSVEIDRLTILGQARLAILRSGNLSVLADYTQIGGSTNIDGVLSTGEALVVGGEISGRGTFDPTYLTVIGGLINPGGRGFGTLTIQGDLIHTSTAVSWFNINRTSADKIAVTGDADNPGVASLAGTALFSAGRGARPRDSQEFEILTAEGGVDGTFDNVLGRIGVLRPELIYGANNVTVRLRAGSLAANLRGDNRSASAFANALDGLRTNSYNSLYGLYGAIDVMDSASLTATLQGLSPTIVGEAMAVGIGQNDMMLGLVSNRLSMLGTGSHQTGTFSVVGAPEMLGVAAGNASVSRSAATQMSFAGRVVSDGRTLGSLPENVSGFISGGYENGRTATRFGNDSDAQANWHIAMGLEVEVADNLTVGGASAFINGRSTIQGSEARMMTNQAIAYASYRLGGGAYVAGLGSASVTDIETARFVSGGFETARFSNDTRASSYAAGIETGVNIDVAQGFELTPRAAVRYTRSEVQGYNEAGSEIALAIDDVSERRLEGRVGFNFQGESRIGQSNWSIRPHLSADYVRALSQNDSEMTVRFAEAAAVPIILPGIGSDRSWTEMRGGVSLSHGNLSLTTAFETDIGRNSVRDDRAVAEVSFRF